jgi:hypothetical protein
METNEEVVLKIVRENPDSQFGYIHSLSRLSTSSARSILRKLHADGKITRASFEGSVYYRAV